MHILRNHFAQNGSTLVTATLEMCGSSSIRLDQKLIGRFLLHVSFWVIFFYWLYSPRGPGPLISVSWTFLQTVGPLGRVISSSQGLYLNTGQHKQSKHTHQTSMPWVVFEPMIPAFELGKTVHALDHSATVTSFWVISHWQIVCFWTLSFVLFLCKTPSCLYFKIRRFGD
jgi:hypothetical protein